jgi:acetyl-CoA carboxylase carboxyltransferase component
MSWQPELDDIARRKLAAQEHGGTEKVARHRAAGKLLVRERLAQLLDVNSFREVGSISGFAQYDEQGELTSFSPSNVICGRGTINGRVVFVTGDDFTVRGGANDGGVMEKFVYAETTAAKLQIPLVRLVDGTGGGGSVKHLETMGRTYLPDVEQFTAVLDALSEVPIVALALGSVAGMGAARVVASHYSLMVQGTSQAHLSSSALALQSIKKPWVAPMCINPMARLMMSWRPKRRHLIRLGSFYPTCRSRYIN